MLKNHRRLALPILLGLGILVLIGCSRSSATGHYIAKFTNGIYGLQLVETPDGHLTGQLDTVLVNPSSKIEYTSYAATGVADGGGISLSFKQAALLGAQLTGSGTINGNSLSLTGNINPGKLSTVVFVRASDAQYQSAVNDLISQANSAASAKVAAENQRQILARQHAFATAVEGLVSAMQRFDADAETHLARWPGAEQSYREITAKMDVDLNRERSLVGNANASVQRGQIAVAISQTSINTDQMHNGAMSIQNTFEANITPLLKQMENAVTWCTANDISMFDSEVKSSCADVVHQSQLFRQKYAAFNNGLIQLEQVYQEEHKKQAQLIQASEQIE